MHSIIIFFIVLFLHGCSYPKVNVDIYASKIYTIIDQEQTVLKSALNQDALKSFYNIKNNRLYAKASFNDEQVLVYLVGLYSKGKTSHISAYHFDSRSHPITTNHKMAVYDFKVNFTDLKAQLSGKLISIAKGAHTNYHHNKKVIELDAIVLNKANSGEGLKSENLFIKERLLKYFPQFE